MLGLLSCCPAAKLKILESTGGMYLAVPVAVKPVDDARALGAQLQRHRGQVLGGLSHDKAPDTAAT